MAGNIPPKIKIIAQHHKNRLAESCSNPVSNRVLDPTIKSYITFSARWPSSGYIPGSVPKAHVDISKPCAVHGGHNTHLTTSYSMHAYLMKHILAFGGVCGCLEVFGSQVVI